MSDHGEAFRLEASQSAALDSFSKYLSVWVLLCMVLGTLTGVYLPAFAKGLSDAAIAEVNLPIATLVWLMVFPMMLQVDFSSIGHAKRFAVPLGITSFVNFGIQPFAMYGFARLFFSVVFSVHLEEREQEELVAGAVLLGAGPCTAMVFVWSLLVGGDALYTLVQVAVNDILLLFLFAPIVGLLLETGTINVPWLTIILSTALFILVPLALAVTFRCFKKDWLEIERFNRALELISRVALVLTVFFIFVMQGERMVNNVVLVFMILVPLTLQTLFVFLLAVAVMYLMKVDFRFAAPGALIATSNFFELSVAVAITSFGPQSDSVLVNVCGVLEEVPLMLILVYICKKLKPGFAKFSSPALKQPTLEHEQADSQTPKDQSLRLETV